MINSLLDEVFGDIRQVFNTELISLAAQVFNYSLGETTGFPFEKNTQHLEIREALLYHVILNPM